VQESISREVAWFIDKKGVHRFGSLPRKEEGVILFGDSRHLGELRQLLHYFFRQNLGRIEGKAKRRKRRKL
jgi:hypothetical protein